jgi:hypothetical protein
MHRIVNLEQLVRDLDQHLDAIDKVAVVPGHTLMHTIVGDVRCAPTVDSRVIEVLASVCSNIINTGGGTHEDIHTQYAMALGRMNLLDSFGYRLIMMLWCGWAEYSGECSHPIKITDGTDSRAYQQYSDAKAAKRFFTGEYGAANFRLCEYLISVCNKLLENPVIDFSPDGSDYW